MTVKKENPDAYAGLEKPSVLEVQFFAKEGDRLPVLSFIANHEGVTVRSNVPSWGAAPIQGREHLKALRDGAIEACKHFCIE